MGSWSLGSDPDVSYAYDAAQSRVDAADRHAATLASYADRWKARAESAEDLFENFARPEILRLMMQVRLQELELDALRAELVKRDQQTLRGPTRVR